MLVSAIIPNYNHARFLEKRIESILHQTFRDFEIIILDDCSTDNSRMIIERYRGNPKVSQIIYNESNSGSTFKQWNKGISAAKGDVIWIAESDDWCEEDFLETLVNGMQQNPRCVVAYTQSYCVDNENNVRWQSRHSSMSEYINGKDFFEQRLIYGCTIFNASMAIFRKEYFPLISQEFINFKMAGDWLFWISMTKFGDVFVSGKVLNYFRKDKENVSSKIFSSGYNFIEELRVLQMVRDEKRVRPGLLKKALFVKYNNFLYKKERIKKEDVSKIYNAFYAFAGSRLSFYLFLISMRLKARIKKVRIRLNQMFPQQLETASATKPSS